MLKQSWIQSDWLDEYDEEPEIDSDYVNDLVNINVTLDNYMQLIKLADFIQVKNVDVLIDAIVRVKNDINCVTEFEDFYKLSPRLKTFTKNKLRVAIEHFTTDEMDCFVTYGHISYWDISGINDMSYMFENIKFNGDISKWDVSNVTNMNSMFNGCNVELPKLHGTYLYNMLCCSESDVYLDTTSILSNWDVSKVTNMRNMFGRSSFNGDISKWDVSNVTCMNSMFMGSTFNGDISNWDVSSVTDMNYMFYETCYNGVISNWNVSGVTRMSGMFCCSKFNGVIAKWNVSNVTRMDDMFGCSKFNGVIARWNVSSVTNMKYMFSHSEFKGDISKWNVSNVTNMDHMFDKIR